MTKLTTYFSNATEQDWLDTPCSICGEHNLDAELCFNCKHSLQCVNCCGCYDEDGEYVGGGGADWAESDND